MPLYNNEGCKIGKITSGGFSPTLNISIAMGYIKNKYLDISKKIFCSIRGKMELIQVSKLPFVNLNYKIYACNYGFCNVNASIRPYVRTITVR